MHITIRITIRQHTFHGAVPSAETLTGQCMQLVSAAQATMFIPTPKRLRKRQHAARRELIHTSAPAVTATMLLRRKPSIRQFGSTQQDRRFTTPALSIWSVLFVTRQYQHLLLLLSQRQM